MDPGTGEIPPSSPTKLEEEGEQGEVLELSSSEEEDKVVAPILKKPKVFRYCLSHGVMDPILGCSRCKILYNLTWHF